MTVETMVGDGGGGGGGGGGGASRRSILVVDDSAIMRNIVTDFAEDCGYEGVGVDSGQAALDLLQHRSFDLIFLDVFMPEMTGMELLQRLRKTGNTVRVVIMTSDRSEDVFDDARTPTLKISGFINKPFTFDVFKSCLKTVIDLRGVFSHKKEGMY